MKLENIVKMLRRSALVVAALLAASAAQAQTFVSVAGNNANPCTREAPCRGLKRGINATPAGGVLTILDSGEYGPTATITKSITIVADGVTASVRAVASGSTAITINAPNASVVLRGLLLTGGGTGRNGIEIVAAKSVHIARCAIERFTGAGIYRLGSDDTQLFITDTVSRLNGREGLGFVGGAGNLTIDRSRFNDNSNGIFIQGIVDAMITHAEASGNSFCGIHATTGRLAVSRTTANDNGVCGFQMGGHSEIESGLTLESSEARGNGESGLHVYNNGVARVSNSVFTNNQVGILPNAKGARDNK